MRVCPTVTYAPSPGCTAQGVVFVVDAADGAALSTARAVFDDVMGKVQARVSARGRGKAGRDRTRGG